VETKLRKGQEVTGELFDNGVVVALGSAETLATSKLDTTGALFDALRSGMILPEEPCVAVRTKTEVAVYVADEVWALCDYCEKPLDEPAAGSFCEGMHKEESRG
jgi:hypothetical protein